MIAEAARTAVLRTAQALLAHGLTIGDSGNVSAWLSGPELKYRTSRSEIGPLAA